MFIKVFVPNANGKIELSVQELEALLKDAAAKAVSEKCANCNKDYWHNWYSSCNENAILTYPSITVSKIAENNIVDMADSATHPNNHTLEGKVHTNPSAFSYAKLDETGHLTYTANTTKGE